MSHSPAFIFGGKKMTYVEHVRSAAEEWKTLIEKQSKRLIDSMTCIKKFGDTDSFDMAKEDLDKLITSLNNLKSVIEKA